MSDENGNGSGERAARPRQVCVVGGGYVGLTAAVGLAELGHRVRCVEADAARLDVLLSGDVPIYEPGLAELMSAHVATGQLAFTGDVAEAVEGADVALLCVGTPPRADGDPDLRQLAAAAVQVASAVRQDIVLVVKSTVPPGSCEALELVASGHAAQGAHVHVASNPEFLREGRAVWDFFHPDRVVVGADDDAHAAVVASLYPQTWPLLVCDRRSAELVKYASNTFLAIKISFANEVAGMCEALGADAGKVLAGVGLDSRIGSDFLRPGPGFGGSCLPKDLSGFVAVADAVGRPAEVARAAARANEDARDAVVAKLQGALGSLAGRRIGVLGLAFKAGTDDVRSSPALALATTLAASGSVVQVHDPVARVATGPFTQCDDPYEAVSGADAVVVATGWPELAELDPEEVAGRMSGHVLLDTVGIIDLARFGAAGLDVYGIGRGRQTTFMAVPWRPLEWMVDDTAGPDLAGVALSRSASLAGPAAPEATIGTDAGGGAPWAP